MERELNERLSHAPLPDSDGSSAARACRTRASASVVRRVASSTTGVLPAAMFTASANERRSGAVAAGACAASGATPSHATKARSGRLLFRDTMEIQVDMGVEILLNVEALRHAGRTGAAGDVGELSRLVAALHKLVERGSDQLLRPGVFAPLPAGLGLALRGNDRVCHEQSPELVTERSVSNFGSRRWSTHL